MKNFDKVVTTALLYANGPLHIGHMLENIQADVYVRFLRMQQEKCLFISGNDAHGTPIMLKSQAKKIPTEKFLAEIHEQHKQSLQKFNIKFDKFITTHDTINKQLTTEIFENLTQEKLIEVKEILQPFDTEKQMFLPDRYIKGTCPKCLEQNQYGDNCEKCGSTYSANELIDPISVVSSTKPCLRKSKHYFFKLSSCESILKEWLKGLDCNNATLNKLHEWFDSGLMDWDISRDKPYFGFNIPNETDKFFYVWVDAPVGYLAACHKYCSDNNLNLLSLLGKNSKTEFIHFIGKDITYFHALFWPAMLHFSKYKKPTAIYPHGFLTVNQQKMSKSKNTFITADYYLKHFDPDFLRYYFCNKLSSKIEDIDFNWQDFQNKNNAELIGKIINIASRCAKILNKNFDNTLAPSITDTRIYEECTNKSNLIADLYKKREYSKAVKEVIKLADQINQYIAETMPWSLIKEDASCKKAHQICSTSIQCFRCLICYIKPITPNLALRAEEFLNYYTTTWEDIQNPLLGHKLNPYKHLLSKIDVTQQLQEQGE